MKRTITRVKGNRFCTAEVTLADGRLSICGVAGDVVSVRAARKHAREYWVSFFEANPQEIFIMNKRHGTAFRSARGAAAYVIEQDGVYHGIDVVGEHAGRVLVCHSAGQIREEIAEFFPEVVPYFRWHLNDMHAECEHQEAAAITYQTHGCHVCTECGWKLGHGWHKRQLPDDVVRWVSTFGLADGDKEVDAGAS